MLLQLATLIELLIVVVIIGILAAIAIPIFLNQQKAAVQAGVKADTRTLQIAVQTYLTKNPEATNLEFRQTGSGAPSGALADDPKFREILGYSWSTSDPRTIMVVRDQANASGAGIGTWEKYVVLGNNGYVGTDGSSAFIFRYYSETGKYLSVN